MPGFPHEGDEPYPKLPEPVEVVNPIYETLEQVVEILTTHQAGDAPATMSLHPCSVRSRRRSSSALSRVDEGTSGTPRS